MDGLAQRPWAILDGSYKAAVGHAELQRKHECVLICVECVIVPHSLPQLLFIYLMHIVGCIEAKPCFVSRQ